MFAPVQCASQPQKPDPETRTGLVVWCYCWTQDHSMFMRKTLLIVAGLAYLMPCGAQENPTLAAVLTEHSIALPPEPAPHLNARITSYGILDDEKEFLIGYYLDRPNYELKAPLLLTRFDKTSGAGTRENTTSRNCGCRTSKMAPRYPVWAQCCACNEVPSGTS